MICFEYVNSQLHLRGMKNLLFTVLISSVLIGCETKPERVIESEWNPEQPKLVAFYTVNEGDKIKLSEEKYYENGNLEYSGGYDADGNRDGDWKYYYPSGTLWSEGSYINGLKSGIKKVYWPEGTIRYEGKFDNDEKTGRWVFYDKEGNILDERDYSSTAEK
ncbi:MAG: hypothetical protein Salg2KO_01240 [Salibacteraceae bacterium]